MQLKENIQQFFHRLKESWNSGKFQRGTRITYGIIWNIVLFFLVVGVIGAIFIGGIGAGYFASLVEDEEIRDYEAMAADIYNYTETSRMYFADEIFLGEVSADLHRDETTLNKIAPELTAAVIATEDEYFNEHEGIVPKAILRALVQEVTGAPTQTGGSTLTQQLIKNQLLTNEVSFERKAKEILLAMRLERFFDKNEILEAYFNIIPYGRDSSGRNIAGVQTAAQGIFGVDASDVNLAQAAYLAGLPQSPSTYTPFANGGGLKSEEGMEAGLNRMKTVLNRMLEMNYITQEEYEEALQYDIVADFKEEEALPFEKYPVLAAEIQREAIDIIYNHLLETDGITSDDLAEDPDLEKEYNAKARQALQMNGYEIHSTIDKELYDTFQEVGTNFENYGPNTITSVTDYNTGETTSEEQQVQGAAVMIENSTGKILSFFGNRFAGEDTHFNFASQAKRSNGSTMKPILVYGPSLEEGLLQPGTPIADVFFEVPNNGDMHEIQNVNRRHHGILSARENLAVSHNIPAVKSYLQLIDMNPVDKYLRKMGITTLTDFEYAHPTLAIGATYDGITIEENTNAFSTIANGGQFADAYIIDKITTNDGDVIYEHEVETTEVFSPQTSYLLLDMMRDVISDGTARDLRSQLTYPQVDWAGKTGTSQDYWDVHFVGSNPNITFATWMGYEKPDSLETTQSVRNRSYWAAFINAASEIRPEIVAPDQAFQRPDGIVERSYCAISGKLPSDLCERAGLVKTDLFNEKFVPTEVDDSLITGNQIRVNGRAVSVSPDTPNEFTSSRGLMFNPDFLQEKGYDELPDITQIIPTNGDRSKWENISFPNMNGESLLETSGGAPSAPSSLSISGNQLTWSASSSNDVVGYRIYRGASSDGNFSRVGSSTSTDFQTGSGDGIYHVRAVNYFGEESAPSSSIEVGNVTNNNEDDNEVESESENDEDTENQSEEDNEDEEDEEEQEEEQEIDEDNENEGEDD